MMYSKTAYIQLKSLIRKEFLFELPCVDWSVNILQINLYFSFYQVLKEKIEKV